MGAPFTCEYDGVWVSIKLESNTQQQRLSQVMTTHQQGSVSPTDVPKAVHGPSVWSAEDVASSQRWLYQLSDAEVSELCKAATRIDKEQLDLCQIDKERFPLPAFAPALADLHQQITEGVGIVQIRGLPIQQIGRRRTAIIFWGLCQHLSDEVVPQNAQGHMLGHVQDLGQSFDDPYSRGPYTHERIEYHSDACDIVGLLCLCPAAHGGESSLASAGLVYNELQRQRPDLAEALLQPLYRDRRGEIPPNREAWYAFPVFNFSDGQLSVNNEPSYIDSVARFFSQDPNTPAQHEGLAFLEKLAHKNHIEIPFEAGDMQFIHNHTILHSREAFNDADGVNAKRHLLRVWLLDYDGISVPEAYYQRNGTPETNRRPGGIVGADTKPHASLDTL